MTLDADIYYVLQQSENGIRFYIQINIKVNGTFVLPIDLIVWEEYKSTYDNKI
jgi:hypothetical protein